MNRLSTYRALEGLNQAELGELLDLSPQMISMMESGRRNAENANLDPLGYEQSRLVVPDMSEPLHRHRASTRVSAKKRAKELLRLAGEVFAELRDVVANVPPQTIHKLGPPASLAELEAATVEVRCALEHEEHGPIRNLTAAIERAGVCVIPLTDLPGVELAGIDGLSSWVEGTPVIGIKPNIPGDRFRFTLSHELGHLLFHTARGDTTEREANRFAGALLFPEPDVDAAMPARPQLRDFIALKASWGMAISALVYRAHELDYVDDRRYRQLQIQMSKWKKNEPGRFEAIPGKLLGRMVESQGGVQSVSNQLGVNPRHLRDLLTWSHLRVA